MKTEDIAHFRRAVRRHLAERPTVAQNPGTIWRNLRREWECQPVDVVNACEFLAAMNPPQLVLIPDPMGGAEKNYKATPDGIIAYEREG